MKTAAVYRKDSLTVLPHLIQKEFGLSFDTISGACMVANVCFGVNAVTGIPLETMTTAINKRIKGYVSSRGLTLAEIAAPFKKELSIELGAVRHDTINSALNAMKQGRIVIAVIDSEDYIDFGYGTNGTGILKDGHIRRAGGFKDGVRFGAYLHSLMLIGHDEKEKTVLFRDIRSRYGFKGYGKINHNMLMDYPHALAYVEVVVQ